MIKGILRVSLGLSFLVVSGSLLLSGQGHGSCEGFCSVFPFLIKTKLLEVKISVV